jgi:hypothetical protein
MEVLLWCGVVFGPWNDLIVPSPIVFSVSHSLLIWYVYFIHPVVWCCIFFFLDTPHARMVHPVVCIDTAGDHWDWVYNSTALPTVHSIVYNSTASKHYLILDIVNEQLADWSSFSSGTAILLESGIDTM